jgi:hypothetical protein
VKLRMNQSTDTLNMSSRYTSRTADIIRRSESENTNLDMSCWWGALIKQSIVNMHGPMKDINEKNTITFT